MKSWEECKEKDLKKYGLRRKDAYNQKKWREQIRAKIAANLGQLIYSGARKAFPKIMKQKEIWFVL